MATQRSWITGNQHVAAKHVKKDLETLYVASGQRCKGRAISGRESRSRRAMSIAFSCVGLEVPTQQWCLLFKCPFSQITFYREHATWHIFLKNVNREVEWIESRSANHLMYVDLYEINHLSSGFSAKASRRARSGYYWKLQAPGEARDPVADAIGNVSCLQRVGLWNTAIQLHQHVTASHGRKPHGKFLIFACYSTSSWDLCGVARLWYTSQLQGLEQFPEPWFASSAK